MRFALVLLLMAACSPADLLNAGVSREGYRRAADIVYGDAAMQQLDVYVPENATSAAPVVLFVHGGRWQDSDKNDYRFVGQALSSRGMIAVVPDYRQYPEVRFPAFSRDIARAIRWTHDHVREYGGSSENIYLAGHSAGAQVAALAMLDPRYLRAEGLDASAIRGFIGLAGPYDFLPFEKQDEPIFAGSPPAETQPVTYADRPGLPPSLLLYGDEDTTVRPKNSISLDAHLRNAGNSSRLVRYPDIGHIGILLAFAEGWRGSAPVLNDVAGFVQTTSGQ